MEQVTEAQYKTIIGNLLMQLAAKDPDQGRWQWIGDRVTYAGWTTEDRVDPDSVMVKASPCNPDLFPELGDSICVLAEIRFTREELIKGTTIPSAPELETA